MLELHHSKFFLHAYLYYASMSNKMNISYNFISTLAWEPSAAQVTIKTKHRRGNTYISIHRRSNTNISIQYIDPLNLES